MATIYRSTDTDAPQIPFDDADYSGADFFMTLLKACLVDGYGSKSAAGWSVDYEDTTADKRRLGLSNGNGVLELITWGTRGVGMVLWDSITTAGTGRLYDDDFATVMSEGVNGWKDEQVEAPGAESDYMAAINAYYFQNSYYSGSMDWTVYADDKSAWILFHYPDGHADAQPEDNIDKLSQHVQLFMGAIKSPDLGRADTGNFFIGYPARSMATSANPSGSGNQLSNIWGLRTPMGTVPSTGNNPEFAVNLWNTGSEYYLANPYSSVRMTIPLLVAYHGADVPKPAGLSTSYSHYIFGAFPGMAQFSYEGTSQAYNFWSWYTAENSSTWNLETHTIGGVTWRPWSLKTDGSYNGFGVTADAGWWA